MTTAEAARALMALGCIHIVGVRILNFFTDVEAI